jgi:hypothetical protein
VRKSNVFSNLWLNLEEAKLNKMLGLHWEDTGERGQGNIKHNCKGRMHACGHTWYAVFQNNTREACALLGPSID